MYPRANTPGCTKQACGFRDNYEDISRAGAAPEPCPRTTSIRFFPFMDSSLSLAMQSSS